MDSLFIGGGSAGPLPTSTQQHLAAVGFGILNADTSFRFVNEAFAFLNGVSAEDHIGNTVRTMLPEAADDMEELLFLARDSGEAVRDVPIRWTDSTGFSRFVSISYRPDYDAGGVFVGWTCIAQPGARISKEAAEAAKALRGSIARLRIQASRGEGDLLRDGDGSPRTEPDD